MLHSILICACLTFVNLLPKLNNLLLFLDIVVLIKSTVRSMSGVLFQIFTVAGIKLFLNVCVLVLNGMNLSALREFGRISPTLFGSKDWRYKGASWLTIFIKKSI